MLDILFNLASAMGIRFGATEVVQLDVPETMPPIEKYLAEIDRIVGVIANPERTTKLAADQFRLEMEPIGFLDLYNFTPVVTLKIWCDRQAMVHIQSLDCRLVGLEEFMEDFELVLEGTLSPVAHPADETTTQLQGKAELSIGLTLPAPLRLTPQPLLQMTGDRLLGEVLQRIKHQLLQQLLQDYQQWAEQQ